MDILFIPLLFVMGITESELILGLSCVLVWIVPLPFFLAAGKQDKKYHEIDGIILVTIGTITVLHCLLFVNIIATMCATVALYFTFRKKELAIIGQADFTLLAHWLFAPFCFNSGEGLMVVESIIFLIMLIIYTRTYRDENGKKWHRGKMVPLFPPYTATVCIMAVISIPASILCYHGGL